jgi:hypothetical protein
MFVFTKLKVEKGVQHQICFMKYISRSLCIKHLLTHNYVQMKKLLLFINKSLVDLSSNLEDENVKNLTCNKIITSNFIQSF